MDCEGQKIDHEPLSLVKYINLNMSLDNGSTAH